MRPLTDTVAKPLLPVGGKPLIAWHLERLAALGIAEVVVNVAHLAEQFPLALGDGTRFGLRIRYSQEGATPLETGGALLHAAALLGSDPFLLVNGDVWTDFDFARLPASPAGLAHLVMVDPPGHAAAGDFHLAADGLLHADGEPRLTYAGIGIYRPQLLTGWRGIVGHAPGAREQPPRFPLAPLLRAAMRSGGITGEHHTGRWTDVGTPERLAALNQSLR
jgi:MurNAc alpha-1-phosphate uridylyltransferase